MAPVIPLPPAQFHSLAALVHYAAAAGLLFPAAIHIPGTAVVCELHTVLEHTQTGHIGSIEVLDGHIPFRALDHRHIPELGYVEGAVFPESHTHVDGMDTLGPKPQGSGQKRRQAE